MLVILDRDGVINEDLPRGVLALEQFRFIEGSPEAIAALSKAGHVVVIATNQSSIGKGWMDVQMLDTIHTHMREYIERAGGRIENIYVAPDAPHTPSLHRKPAPGMLLEAMQDFASLPSNTVMIGDALRDLQAAHAAGCRAILVATGKGEATHKALPQDFTHTPYVANLAAAAQLLLATADKAD